jgi:hypothetical protein
LQRDLGETPDICLLALKAHQSTYENVQAVANKCSTITLKELYIQVEAEDYMQIKSIKNLRAMMKEKWFLEMDQTSREKSDQLLQTFLDVRPLKENFLNFCTHTHSAIKQARQQSGR